MNTLIIWLSLVAGVVGTGIGGMIGVIISDRGGGALAQVIAFAGGIMMGVTSLDMLPEALAAVTYAHGPLIVIGSAVAGGGAIWLVNVLLDHIERKKLDMFRGSAVIEAKSKVGTLSAKAKNRRLLKAGTVMLVAIALHNLPEGIAIGASGANMAAQGVLVAIVIAVHNIPEGMAIGAPLAGGGINPFAAVGLATLAGGATVIGAVIGLLLGGLNSSVGGICLAAAGGAMLYVTCAEMLPESIRLSGKFPSASFLIGYLASAALVYSF